jgi:site-specific DNA recombinase
MNAIGYVRISKKDQSMYSLDAQENLIREYCTRNNVSLFAVFRDDGECSYSFDRPDYIALENFIKEHKGQVNYLIIKDHDRFSRNISEALAKISSLEKKFGVKVIAVDEPITIDTSDPNIFLNRAFKYLMANHELLNIRRRTTQGIRNAIASGRVVNNAPYGYINIRDDQGKPTLQIEEGKAIHVRRVFEQFISGISLPLIIKEARANGFNRTGKSALMRLLTNPVYAGLLRLPAYNGEPERLVKAIHTPIISEPVFWIASEKINGQPRYRTVPKDDFPLRGIIKCDCGWHLTASYSKGKKKYYMYYSCPKERNRNYRGETMHELIENVLMELSFTSQQLNRISILAKEELSKGLKDKKVLLDSKMQKLKELKLKMENLEEKMINNEIETITYKKWFTKLSAEKGSLEIEIAGLSKTNTSLFEKLDKALPLLTNLKTLYNSAKLSGKQLLLKRVFEGGLTYNGSRLRTPRLHLALLHNYQRIKEKGLLLLEQPDEKMSKTEGCTTYGIRTRDSSVKGRRLNPLTNAAGFIKGRQR